MINSKQIEDLSVGAVSKSISLTSYLSPFIQSDDKEPSWDGFVYIYTDKSIRKDTLKGRVPVQVKGKVCSDFTKNKIKYSVEVVDLKNYLEDGGVMFYVVYLNNNLDSDKIYYSALTPVRLHGYLKNIGDQKYKTIELKEFMAKGEEIAVNGTFSIDAAAQLAGKPSMMSPEGGPTMTGHDHGGTEMVDASFTPVEALTETTTSAFKAQLTKVYKDYLDMKNAFVETDAKKVAGEAKDVIAALKSVDMGLLKGDAHMMWMDQLEVLNSTINAISKSNDIEKQRQEFVQFNLAFYKSVKMFGLENVTAYYQFCPMANNDKGAYWLSEIEEIHNPYFGDMMLSCGEVKETIK